MLKYGVQKKGSELPGRHTRARTLTHLFIFLFKSSSSGNGSWRQHYGNYFSSGLLAFMDGPIIDQNIIGVVLGNGVLNGFSFLSAMEQGVLGSWVTLFYLMAFGFTSYMGTSEVTGWEWV